jgi:serine/threonine protein kinase
MAKLKHPAIVGVVQEFGTEGSARYFVMEYVNGGDLAEAVRHGRFSPKYVISALLSIGEALAHAHGQGVVHRDVKPANVLLDPEHETLKLTDFDLGRAVDTTGGTRTGGMGTWLYAAPELMKDAKRADARVDVYALGMIAQFILLGRDLPLDVLTAAERFQSSLTWPVGLRAIVEKACSHEPRDRFASALDMCDALQTLTRAGGTGPTGGGTRARRSGS